MEDGCLEVGECFLGSGFGGEITGDGDIDYGARGYVWRKEDGWEFNLRCKPGMRPEVYITYYSLVFGQEDGHAGVDLSDSQ